MYLLVFVEKIASFLFCPFGISAKTLYKTDRMEETCGE